MKKSEIIELLEQKGIEFDKKATKEELESLLVDETTETVIEDVKVKDVVQEDIKDVVQDVIQDVVQDVVEVSEKENGYDYTGIKLVQGRFVIISTGETFSSAALAAEKNYKNKN